MDRSPSPPAAWTPALRHLRAAHRRAGRPGAALHRNHQVGFVAGPADSITEGVGATSRETTWWSVFGDALARALGWPARGAPRSAEVSEHSRWSLWSRSGPEPIANGLGIGAYGLTLLPGTTLATDQRFDALTVLTSSVPNLADLRNGSLEVVVDGTVAATIPPRREPILGARWDSGRLPFGPHHVELRSGGDGFALVDHVYFHDDPDSPLFWRGGHAGYDSGAGQFGFANESWGWMGAFSSSALVDVPVLDRAIRGGGAVTADCFLIATGTNDIQAISQDPAELAVGYRRMIRYLRTRADTPASIGIVVPTTSVRSLGHHDDLRRAATDACRTEGAFLIDLGSALGTHADDADGWYADGTHPNDRGHEAWGRYVAAWMLEALEGPTS